jgi:pyruvate kinase
VIEFQSDTAQVRKATQEIRRDGLKPRDVERADAGICAVAFDVKGPEIRVGRFGPSVAAPQFQQLQDDGTSRTVSGPKEIVLTRGDVLTITTDPALADTGTAHQIYIGYQPLTRQLKPGSLIYIVSVVG